MHSRRAAVIRRGGCYDRASMYWVAPEERGSHEQSQPAVFFRESRSDAGGRVHPSGSQRKGRSGRRAASTKEKIPEVEDPADMELPVAWRNGPTARGRHTPTLSMMWSWTWCSRTRKGTSKRSRPSGRANKPGGFDTRPRLRAATLTGPSPATNGDLHGRHGVLEVTDLPGRQPSAKARPHSRRGRPTPF